jgi:iron complex outermembrane receptor protein
MVTQEVAITGTVINCVLIEDAEELEEVIVVGYGTMKKTDKTGAVSHVSAEDLNKGVLTDPIQALQGKAAGVMISKSGGDPNAGFSVKIRGSSSLTSGTDPLYVVDGVPGVDPSTISPEDIESFNILKDASSTAIYGTRGANGVIIITTKKGTSGENKVDFNNYVSFDRVAKRLDLLSAEEYRAYVEADTSLNFVDGGASTDWQDEIYRNGFSQNYNISFSGGNENTTYYSSLSHTDFQGVVIGSDKVRSIGRINVTQKALNDRLTIQTNLAGTIENNNYINYDGKGARSVIYQALQRNPTDPVYNTDSTFYETSRDFEYYNPVAIVEQIQNQRAAKKMLGNLKADLEIIDGLILGANLGYTRDDSENFYAEPSYVLNSTTSGSASRSYGNYESKVLETTLNYTTTFAKSNNINILGGYAFQEGIFDGFNAGGTEPMSDVVQSHNLGVLNNVNPGNIGSYKGGSRLISFFGRVQYNYNSKYYLTVSMRRDGSSRFGNENEWGLFPTVSVSWNMSEEKFLASNDFISQLKLRASYGISGNQDIGTNLDVTYYSTAGQIIDPETGEEVIYFSPAHDPNPELKWEETSELNFGLDYGILENKISGSVEYYRKETYNLIYNYKVPQPPSITGTKWSNGDGIIQNNGLEASLIYNVVNKKNFEWTSTLSFTKNQQQVLRFSDLDNVPLKLYMGGVSGRGLVSVNSQILAPGYEVGTFWMPEFADISEDGQFRYYTAEGGITRNYADAELREVGHALPKFILGWSNTFTLFSCVDISFAARYVHDFQVLNVTAMMFGSAKWLPNLNVLEQAVINEEELGLNDSPELSSFYLENGTFLRIDNLNVGYTFNTENSNLISKARIYFSSNNLYTLTNYTGLDPEITYNGLSFGLDQYNVYPKTRTFTFGVNLTF